MTDNSASLKFEPLVKLCEMFGIEIIDSTPYYPQGNGLAESSNKSIVNMIKKLLEDNKKPWYSKFKFSLKADRVTTTDQLVLSHFSWSMELKFSFLLNLHYLWKKFCKINKDS
jgi:transposase InsO family protein